MCMNCGCGELDKRHQPTDITREDVQHAADGGGISVEEAARNLATSSEQLSGGQSANAGTSQDSKRT